ncbi:MAG: type II toxin-antitoxin system RelE/ParE family toxin [Ideonella sp.]|nr:type II toxin-antitoxin system RelE/ParE family toxin [Ideonella sp.]
MSTQYRVVASVTFQEDLERLEEHIVERDLASNAPDDTCLFRFRDAIERAISILSFAPHTCRRSAQHREFRELVIPFGHGGCVVLFAIREPDVLLLAERDQHEHDYR